MIVNDSDNDYTHPRHVIPLISTSLKKMEEDSIKQQLMFEVRNFVTFIWFVTEC
jgi:hypothetical protein